MKFKLYKCKFNCVFNQNDPFQQIRYLIFFNFFLFLKDLFAFRIFKITVINKKFFWVLLSIHFLLKYQLFFILFLQYFLIGFQSFVSTAIVFCHHLIDYCNFYKACSPFLCCNQSIFYHPHIFCYFHLCDHPHTHLC